MLPKKVMKWFRKVELNEKYSRLQCFGVDCWPVVRLSVASALSKLDMPVAATKRSGLINYLKSLVHLFLSFVFLNKKEILILTDSKFSNVINGNKYYKYATAITEGSKEGRNSSLILFSDFYTDSAPEVKDSISVYGVSVFAAFISRLVGYLSPRCFFPVINSLVDDEMTECCQDDKDKEFIRHTVKRNIVYVIIARMVFIRILKRITPKKVYVVCYYNNLGLALCSACKFLDIEIIDIQHGVSGRNMRAYGNWNNVPFGGYNTMPNVFLTWTDTDSKAINEWCEKAGTDVVALYTGNLWRSYMIDKRLMFQASASWDDFFENVKEYKGRVLFTMQSTSIGELFKEVIIQASSKICFLVKCHPNLKQGDVKSLQITLNKLSLHVFVDQLNEMPIEYVVGKVDLHVTEWSASVYDARVQNVESIVIAPEGNDYYADFIESGGVCYLDNAKEILKKMDGKFFMENRS